RTSNSTSFLGFADHLDLYTFPTRRSSDLEINKCGGKTHALAANVTQVKQVKALVDAAVKAYSHIDIIINNTRLMLAYRFNFKSRSEEHTSELQSRENIVCRLLLEKKNTLK